MQAVAEFGKGGAISNLSELSKQIVGKRHARHRRSGFQAAMKRIRDIPYLNHSFHAASILAWWAHVNARVA